MYQSGKYAEAAAQYNSASQTLPDAAEIHFNQGNAAYKQQDYGKAREHYTQALQSADRTLEGRVKYNLGNVEYQQALQNLQQPQAAMPHLRSAMTYYRDSLDVDPQQQDARYNLELSHLLLHKLQQEPPQQQQSTAATGTIPGPAAAKPATTGPARRDDNRSRNNRPSSRIGHNSRRHPQTHNRANNSRPRHLNSKASKRSSARTPRRRTRHRLGSRPPRNGHCAQRKPHVCSRRSGSAAVRQTLSDSSAGPGHERHTWTKIGKGSAACLEIALEHETLVPLSVVRCSAAGLVVCCLSLLWAAQHASGAAATVTLQARLAEADIYLGESTSLELRINGVRNPEPPDLAHPDIDITKAGGQSFNNSSYTMINGQVRQSEEFGYVARYLLWPRRAGTLEIPSLTLVHAGQTYRSNPVTLRVQRPPEQDFLFTEVSSNKPSYVLGETVTLRLDLSIRKLTANGTVLDADPFFREQPPHLQIPWFENLGDWKTTDLQNICPAFSGQAASRFLH